MEVVQQHGGVGRALAAVARRGPRDEGVDVVGDARLGERGEGYVVVHVAVGHLDRRLALVRLGAGEQLVEDDADRIDVGAGIRAAVDDQFGCEVGDGADQHPAGSGVLGVGADGLGEAEVGDLDRAAVGLVGDEDVLRLHVAVDQAGPVGRGEGGDDRLQQGQRPRRRHRRLLADHVAQRVAGDVLHDQEDGVGAVGGVVALVVDADDVGMVEACGRAGLAHEALGELVVVTEPGVHHLHRDDAVEAGVGGLVDTGHATAGDASPDAVAAIQQTTDEGVAAGVGRRGAGRRGAGVLGWLHSSTSRAGRGRIRRHHRTEIVPAAALCTPAAWRNARSAGGRHPQQAAGKEFSSKGGALTERSLGARMDQ